MPLSASATPIVRISTLAVRRFPNLILVEIETADGLVGLGETFFGSFALALVTSLPELAVSVAAIRIGAVNLAIANLMGSNATNMALLVALDIASPGANVLAAAAPGVQAAAAAAIILMAVGTSSIVLKAERVRLPVDLAAVLILAGYVLSLWAIYDARGS